MANKKDKAAQADEPGQTVTDRALLRLVHLLDELAWLAALVAACGLVAILASHSPLDPGFTFDSGKSTYLNFGGRFGAWLSDVLLLCFGLSAWWIAVGVVTAALEGLRNKYRRMTGREPVEAVLPWWARVLGFVVLVLSGSGLEALRLTHVSGGDVAGGIIGNALARLVSSAIGVSGTSVVFLLLLAAGLSVGFGFSWLGLCEKIGTAVERCFTGLVHIREKHEDEAIAQEAKSEREKSFNEKVQQETVKPAVRIEPTVVVVPPSDRAAKESQAPLFEEDSKETLPLPTLDLLDKPVGHQETIDAASLQTMSRRIESKLAGYGVSVTVTAAHPGPVITQYEVEPAEGVKGSRIIGLRQDLCRALGLQKLRIVETVPGKTCMGFEVPNPQRQLIRLSELLSSQVYEASSSILTLALGKDIGGNPVVIDLAKMPHLLVAGTTGSGKSVGVNAMLMSMLYKAKPIELKLVLIDPKMLEFRPYEGIPHLLAPVVTDMSKAANALKWCVAEMERRYRLMSQLGVRQLASYNAKILEARSKGETIPDPFATEDLAEPLDTMPVIVVVVDEFADLILGNRKQVEEPVTRLAQKARAAGIHMIIATQRPVVQVLTGLIKANVPARICFQVASRTDSSVVLDSGGGEDLLGNGDMLYTKPGMDAPLRVHGAFVSDREIQAVIDKLKEQGEPAYAEGILDGASEDDGDVPGMGVGPGSGADGEADALYDQAVQIVLESGRPSISFVQRRLQIGYNRSANLIEAMEKAGIVSKADVSGKRRILVPHGDNQ